MDPENNSPQPPVVPNQTPVVPPSNPPAQEFYHPPVAQTPPAGHPFPLPNNPSEPNHSPHHHMFLRWMVFLILGILVLAVLLGGGAYVLMKAKAPVSTPIPVVSKPTPTPVDETANWKTYTNSTHKFSFKYPSGWNVEEQDETKSADGRELLITLNEPSNSSPYQVEVFHFQGEDLQSFINSWYGQIESGPSQIKSINEGNAGYEFFMQKAGVTPSGSANITIRNGMDVFTISTPVKNGNSAEILQDSTLKLITSTFKFTNADSATVQTLVKNFYTDWLTSTTDPGTKADNELAKGFITEAADSAIKSTPDSDLPTCSQNPLAPDAYNYGAPILSGDSATMDVSGTYAGPPSSTQTINLSLIKGSSSWAIKSFTCPTQ